MNSVQIFLSSKGSRRKNLISAKTSSSLFWTGVPVKQRRRSATKSHEARLPTVPVSLIELYHSEFVLTRHTLEGYILCFVEDDSKPVYSL